MVLPGCTQTFSHVRLLRVVQEQGRNIRAYSQYLAERARSFGDVKIDFVRNGQGHLRRLSVEKGLLREVECVQTQLRALLQCNVSLRASKRSRSYSCSTAVRNRRCG